MVVTSDNAATPDRGRGRGRHLGLVVLAAAGLCVAVLALVDQGSDPPNEPSAGRYPTPATLASGGTVGDTGPPATLPGGTGLRVVAFRPATLAVADLDTGERVVVSGASDGDDATFVGGLERAGGIVTVVGEQVVFLPDVEPGGLSIRLDTGYAVLPSDRPHRVWVLAGDPSEGLANTVHEIDLTGAITGETTALPEGVVPVGGVTGGLVLDTPDGVFLLDREGNARRVATGSVVGTFGSSVVHRSCSDDLRCSLYVTDVETGERRQVSGGSEVPAFQFAEQGVSPDGRLLFSFVYAETGRTVTVFDLEGGEVAFEGGPELVGHAAGAVWSPDGRWLFWLESGDPAAGTGTSVGALRTDDWRFFELDLPGGYGLVVLGPDD